MAGLAPSAEKMSCQGDDQSRCRWPRFTNGGGGVSPFWKLRFLLSDAPDGGLFISIGASRAVAGPGGHEHGKVSFVELFFDLVFVFAITQLSHSLIEHFTPLGAVQTLLDARGLVGVDLYVVGHQLAESRKIAGAARAVGSDVVWADSFLLGAGGVRIARLGLCGRLRRDAGGPDAIFHLGSAGPPGHGLAIFSAFSSGLWWRRFSGWRVRSRMVWRAWRFGRSRWRRSMSRPRWDFSCRDLVGEGRRIGMSKASIWPSDARSLSLSRWGNRSWLRARYSANLEWTPAVVAAFVISFAGSLAMWWLYFDTSAAAGSKTISSSHDPGKLARLVYTYIHLFIVGGIIVAAVADEFVLHHPTGHSDFKRSSPH